ncbi:hypothetical protein Lal_00019259, partial [Lupinus albus]
MVSGPFLFLVSLDVSWSFCEPDFLTTCHIFLGSLGLTSLTLLYCYEICRDLSSKLRAFFIVEAAFKLIIHLIIINILL